MVEERPFRAVFGCRIKLGFSPGAEFNRDTSTQLLLYQSKQPATLIHTGLQKTVEILCNSRRWGQSS